MAPWCLDGHDSFNCLITNTCKFSHKTLLIPGHDTYTAKDWASILVRMLLLASWGILMEFILDRDSKFVFAVWRKVFTLMRTKLLYSTAWHPQTDGQSKVKNQHVKIAFRH